MLPTHLRIYAMSLLLALAIGWSPVAGLANTQSPAKYAGTYRIAEWESLQGSSMYHFFYLHHSGDFLLAGEWPGSETSRAVGSWRVDDTHLTLSGVVDVKTNKGDWKVPYSRTFKISVSDKGIILTPLPRKNRFGILGWPNKFIHYRTAPVPNLPQAEIPRDEKNLLVMIRALRAELE